MSVPNIYSAANYSVLIVDDEKLSRDLLTRRLAHEGYAVTTAVNGQAAIALMAIERFDLVLLDINMPVMNGFEVLEWLRRRHGKGMSVIMLTGESDKNAVTSSLMLGAYDYILKSAGIVELLHRVSHACQGAALEAQQDKADKQQWRDFNVLVVDDSSMNQKIIVNRLQQFDPKIHVADDGNAALQTLKNKHIDLVLLDYHMPDMDGLDVLRQIRERWDGDEMGIIMVSAETTPALVTQFYESGANDYIAKPFHAASLLARTKKVLLEIQFRRKERYLAKLAGLGKNIRSSGE